MTTDNPARGKDMKDAWCGNLKHISKTLQTQGNSLNIEMAMDAGALPLKIVTANVSNKTEEAVSAAPTVPYMKPPS